MVRAPRLGQARGPGAAVTWWIISMYYIWDPGYRIYRRGGGPKIVY